MKKMFKQVISILIITILFCPDLSLQVLAEQQQSTETLEEASIEAMEDTEESADIVEDENILQSMEQVPDISEETSVEDQIIVVYEDTRNCSVEKLELEMSDVVEGESLCETVDLFVPDESVDTDELVEEFEKNLSYEEGYQDLQQSVVMRW